MAAIFAESPTRPRPAARADKNNARTLRRVGVFGPTEWRQEAAFTSFENRHR